MAFDGNEQTRWATDDKIRHAWIAAEFLKLQTVSHRRISEAYPNRVQKFEFQYRDGKRMENNFHRHDLGDAFQKSFDTGHGAGIPAEHS